jgi:hypothetical protein
MAKLNNLIPGIQTAPSQAAKEARLKLLYKITAQFVKQSFTPTQFSKTMDVEMQGRADVFDALVKAGRCANFYEAVKLVATTMPNPYDASGERRWSELALFSMALGEDYGGSQAYVEPPMLDEQEQPYEQEACSA